MKNVSFLFEYMSNFRCYKDSLFSSLQAGSTWYEMLFGGALTEDNVLYNVKLTFTWQSSNQLLIEYIGNT